jgi:glyoxylase-like metal-dependent hydrolase (beta-lactamase superfamily II)
MKISEGVYMLEVKAKVIGNEVSMFPSLMYDAQGGTLVDAGYPGQADLIITEIIKCGAAPEKIDRLFITHQDIDHIGSAQALLAKFSPSVKVYSGEVEREFIEGKKLLEKVTPEAIAKALNALPPNMPDEQKRAFKFRLENPPTVNVDEILPIDEEMPVHGGMVVVPTYGHTSGHLSFYHKNSKTFIAGDCLKAVDGVLAAPTSCTDYKQAIESLKRLLYFDIQSVICYHGGYCSGNVMGMIEDILNGFENG